ncbi:unnamed protein product [Linum tenue]|uniref:TIR domain-containing protein n=1 Tax=Linum tenue TaxID=586396 RepID=A0AAV0IGZ5_9ROSI|nr:unnamed protein product [Linum tenue]
MDRRRDDRDDNGDEEEQLALTPSRPSKRQKKLLISSNDLLILPTKLYDWLRHKFIHPLLFPPPSPFPTPSSSSSSSSSFSSLDLIPFNNNSSSAPGSGSSKYDVFISFRGADVRNSFLSHLHHHLNDLRKLEVYKDDVDLERGEQISPSLLLAIQRSDVYIVILSPKYTDSPWCLEELEEILRCTKLHGRRVIPVFYGVDPSEVESQKLPSSGSAEEIRSWRSALREIANLSGFDSQVTRPETKLVEEITKAVFIAIRAGSQMVKFSSYSASRGLVGVERRIQHIQRLLCSDERANLTIGLWGMAGIGKTALAKAFYDLFSCQFETCYFFSDFADEIASRLSLQPFGNLQSDFFSKLLRDDENGRAVGTLSYDLMLNRLGRMKALVVIDDVGNDVGNIVRLKDLLNGQYCDLFGAGSVVIMTSRNQQLLKSVCHHVYEVKGLDDAEAFRLFCMHAFKGNDPQSEYMEMALRAAKYVDGNPLAIVVLGAHLRGRDLEFWDRELGALQDNLNPVVETVLRRSYDGLRPAEKVVFLDLACFYDNEGIRYLEILEEMSSDGGNVNLITNLVDKSLVNVFAEDGGVFATMPSLLRDLGKSIVNEQLQIEKRTRLWKPRDLYYLFRANKGTQSIEGILNKTVGKFDCSTCIQADAFEKMENLRVLVIEGDDRYLSLSEDGLKCLPNALRILEWRYFPSKYLPPQFSAENLVTLDLCRSKIEQLWECECNVDLGNLKFLFLAGSRSLVKLPNLSSAKRLKVIDLASCASLVELPTSILDLPKLEELDVRECINLKLDSLENHANSSREHNTGHSTFLPNLKKLNLSRTSIQQVPDFICRLHIVELLCDDCPELTEFPELTDFPVIPSLEKLVLTGSSIQEMVEFEKLTELKHLNLSNNKQLVLFAGDFSKLKSLEKIELDGCCKLSGLPDSIGHLVRLPKLSLRGCKSLASLPDTIHKLIHLDALDLVGCDQLRHLPELPSCLRNLDAQGCKSLQTLSIGIVEKLDFTNTTWSFAQCWKLDPGVCSKLVDKFAQDSVRVSQRSSLLLPVKWCTMGSNDSNNNKIVTAKLRGQPWKPKSTIFCALVNSPDPLLINQDDKFLVEWHVECVMLNNKDSAGPEVVVSSCYWKSFRECGDPKEEERHPNGHFLVWSTSGPLVDGENADDGSTLKFFFRHSYKTKDGSRTLNLIRNGRVIPVYDDRVVTNEENDDGEEDDDESPNDRLQGLYDQLCAHPPSMNYLAEET